MLTPVLDSYRGTQQGFGVKCCGMKLFLTRVILLVVTAAGVAVGEAVR